MYLPKAAIVSRRKAKPPLERAKPAEVATKFVSHDGKNVRWVHNPFAACPIKQSFVIFDIMHSDAQP